MSRPPAAPLGSDMRVAVLGATGFVGSSVMLALRRHRHEGVAVSARRLSEASAKEGDVALTTRIEALAERLRGSDAIVNAAGIADASSGDVQAMNAANGRLPGLIGVAAVLAKVERYVHVSSAAVQGRKAILDSSAETSAFSAYSLSKLAGELEAVRHGPLSTIVYRPPGVHGHDRGVTHLMARIARSPFATVAAPGSANSPQALVGNVGDAVVFLAASPAAPPACVHHPSEGLACAGLLELLSGRPPHLLPRGLAGTTLRVVRAAGCTSSALSAHSRRLETLWFGQGQAPSWLQSAGWEPPDGHDAWRRLGEVLAQEQSARNQDG